MGDIAEFTVFTSADGVNWGKHITRGRWKPDKETHIVNFPPVSIRWIRLTILSEVKGRAHASAAEIDIVPADSLPSEG